MAKDSQFPFKIDSGEEEVELTINAQDGTVVISGFKFRAKQILMKLKAIEKKEKKDKEKSD